MTDEELAAIISSSKGSVDEGNEDSEQTALESAPFRFSVYRGNTTITLWRQENHLRLSISGPVDEVAAHARGIYCSSNFDSCLFSERKQPAVWSLTPDGSCLTAEDLLAQVRQVSQDPNAESPET